jgi:hypothetical protein
MAAICSATLRGTAAGAELIRLFLLQVLADGQGEELGELLLLHEPI